MSKRKWSEDQFIEAVKRNQSVRGVLRDLNLRYTGANYETVRTYVNKLSLDTSHWTGQGHNKGKKLKKRKIVLDKILINGSKYDRGRLKKRLVNEGLMEYKCNECGNEGWWKEKSMALVIDHINGINNDNRLENLRFLCPNCNSQTKTFCGRNVKRKAKKIVCKDCGGKLSPYSKTGFCIKCVSKYKKKKVKKYKNGSCKICGKDIKRSKTGLCFKCCKIKERRVKRPSYEQLMKEINETNYCVVGRKYNVTDNAIRKWIKNYENSK